MWDWEQGRLEYFQFDELRKIAKFGIKTNLREASRIEYEKFIGLLFLPDRPDYLPWRNYARVIQIAMLAVPSGHYLSKMTVLGEILAADAKVTSDEYLHFLAQATTQPSPALRNWDHTAKLRYPLLFALRFLLARATQGEDTTPIADIVNTYSKCGFQGDEGQEAFLSLIDCDAEGKADRQPKESIKMLAQLSYLTATTDTVTVSLAAQDAHNLFCDLRPVGGTPLEDKAEEILRRARLFPSSNAELEVDYRASIVSNVREAGFSDAFPEGQRVRRSHLTIERNQMIRRRFFEENPSLCCDLCGMDTHRTYPWTPRLLEVHHLLPLCSGARTSDRGTSLVDLVANCPSCHRAVHRYYDRWLESKNRLDFADAKEAKNAYAEAKNEHRKAVGYG